MDGARAFPLQKGGCAVKRRWSFIAGGLLAAGVLLLALRGWRPYKDLNAADIVSATVHLTPPDETVEIKDRGELAGCLRQLVVWQKSDAFRAYSGQSVTFTLAMADGSRQEVMVCAPFVVINGTGYKAKYEPCEALSRYANGALENIQ